MNIHGKGIKIFSGSSNPKMVNEIALRIGVSPGALTVGRFSDGEVSVSIGEVVRGADVYIVQSTCIPVNDNLIELLVIIDAMKRASAGRITAVMPYFGYARQDRKAKARDPISAKLVANLVTVSGADRVLTMDLHTPQIQGFFDIPVDHLLGAGALAEYFAKDAESHDAMVAVSPDAGSANRTRYFAEYLDIPIAIGDKRRTAMNDCEVIGMIGEVKDKKCIIFDDVIDTGGTIIKTAEVLMELGAAEVCTACTHGVFSGNALERLQSSCLSEVVLLDTIPLSEAQKAAAPKLVQLSVSGLFAEAIERIYGDRSLSVLFDKRHQRGGNFAK
ncbi:MAG: ribose-phosphate pyrophosphokinase [Oscillospiraceae bacterium]|nr:ribose-phosphate pyrophosphokinase [Oscillospiraceae bacterium]